MPRTKRNPHQLYVSTMRHHFCQPRNHLTDLGQNHQNRGSSSFGSIHQIDSSSRIWNFLQKHETHNLIYIWTELSQEKRKIIRSSSISSWISKTTEKYILRKEIQSNKTSKSNMQQKVGIHTFEIDSTHKRKQIYKLPSSLRLGYPRED